MLLRSGLVLFFVVLPVGLHAAEPAANCGSTPHDAVAVSETALAAHTEIGRDQALRCLLKAVKQLDAWKATIEPKQGHSGIAVPTYPNGPQGGQ